MTILFCYRLNYYNKLIQSNPNLTFNQDSNKQTQQTENKNPILRKNSLPPTPEHFEIFTNNQFSNEKLQISNDKINLLNDLKQNQFLENFFNTNPLNNEKREKTLHYSNSFDESLPTSTLSTSRTANKKLEDFRRLVESSYIEHVVKKTNHLSSSNVNNHIESTYLNPTSKNLYDSLNDLKSNTYNNNYSRTNSHNNINSITPDEPNLKGLFSRSMSITSENSFTLEPKDTIYSRRSESKLASPIVMPCKVPIMSAYNIYNNEKIETNSSLTLLNDGSKKNETRNSTTIETQQFMEKYLNSLDTQKMNNENKDGLKLNTDKFISSTGSSLNTSPTSLSSNGSLKKIIDSPPWNDDLDLEKRNPRIEQFSNNERVIPTLKFNHEVKPPETPRVKSAVSTYRKNLIKIANSKNKEVASVNNSFSSTQNMQKVIDDEKERSKIGLNTMPNGVRNFKDEKQSDLVKSQEGLQRIDNRKDIPISKNNEKSIDFNHQLENSLKITKIDKTNAKTNLLKSNNEEMYSNKFSIQKRNEELEKFFSSQTCKHLNRTF